MSHIFTVTLPDIGEGVVEGEVTSWLKNVGDELKQDEPVVEVMTDKATVELPAPHPGKLAKQYFQPGEIASVGKPLYDIATEEQQNKPVKDQKNPIEKTVKQDTPTPTQTAEKPQTKREGHKALATPLVRRVARELGVNLGQIIGSGKDGRITMEDLRSTLGNRSPAAPLSAMEGDEVKPLIGVRNLTAKRVTESKRNIPHFCFCDKADVTLLIKFREKVKEEAIEQGIKLTFVPMFVRALSLTLKQFPQVNASVDGAHNSLILHQPHNVGIAMKTQHGLIVPVMKNVQNLSFHEIVRQYVVLKDKAFHNQLKREDMIGSTITLSNFGTEGGLWATPVINYPEAAILATAKIHPEAVVRGGQIVIRNILNCSWSFDHRIIDGDMAAAFSNHFIHLLENPVHLL